MILTFCDLALDLAGSIHPSGTPKFIPVFIGFCVVQYLLRTCSCCWSWLFCFYLFSFDHCIVFLCPFGIFNPFLSAIDEINHTIMHSLHGKESNTRIPLAYLLLCPPVMNTSFTFMRIFTPVQLVCMRLIL